MATAVVAPLVATPGACFRGDLLDRPACRADCSGHGECVTSQSVVRHAGTQPVVAEASWMQRASPFLPVTRDVDGEPRAADGAPDLGVDEG